MSAIAVYKLFPETNFLSRKVFALQNSVDIEAELPF
jgi:hypothetical protein